MYISKLFPKKNNINVLNNPLKLRSLFSCFIYSRILQQKHVLHTKQDTASFGISSIKNSPTNAPYFGFFNSSSSVILPGNITSPLQNEIKIKNNIQNGMDNAYKLASRLLNSNTNQDTIALVNCLNSMIENNIPIVNNIKTKTHLRFLRAIGKLNNHDMHKFSIQIISDTINIRKMWKTEYPLLISNLGRCGDWKSATLLYDKAITMGYKENSFINSSIMYSLIVNKRYNEADFMWNKICEENQVNVSTYSTLMSHLVDSKQYNDAIDLYKSMLSKGIEPNKHIFSIMLNCAASINNDSSIDLVTNIIKEIYSRKIELSIISLNSILAGSIKSKRYKISKWLLSKIDSLEIKRNDATWLLALRLQICLKDLDGLNQEIINWGNSTAYTKQQDPPLIHHKDNLEINITPDLIKNTYHWTQKEYLLVISGYTKLKDPKNAITYVELMEYHGISKNKHILYYSILAYLSYASIFGKVETRPIDHSFFVDLFETDLHQEKYLPLPKTAIPEPEQNPNTNLQTYSPEIKKLTYLEKANNPESTKNLNNNILNDCIDETLDKENVYKKTNISHEKILKATDYLKLYTKDYGKAPLTLWKALIS
ncbi:hypothetical protein BB558_003576 [Smittium angustum]|uniref:Pentacotripeptide-repeat region of PRORP domain-containing protein n=1 Tax=Smittium angustum TaxID=133377 RepID=A0A2U1J5Y5_SMIAN|nr:hypothetical protein BB558_003576 [Smittium angustum]